MITTKGTFARSVLVAAVLAAMVLSAPAAASAGASCGPDWSRVASPSPGTIYSVLLDVAAVGPGDAWAVGFRAYLDAQDQYAVSPIVERWDGSSWSVALQPDEQGQLAGVFALSGDDVWAVGHTGLESPDFRPLILHWNGHSWSRVPGPSVAMAYLSAVGGTGPHDVWAAGTLIGTFDAIVEHWDGTRWTVAPLPTPSSDYVALGGLAAAGRDDVWIVGSYLDRQARTAPLSLRWDGAAWHRVRPAAVGQEGTALADVAVDPSGHVWAVGSYATGGLTQALAERWTAGRGWVPDFPPAMQGSASLASITSGSAGTWAVGVLDAPGQRSSTLIERRDPGSGDWLQVGSPNARGGNRLLAVDESPGGELWAVGFHRAGPELTLVVHACP